MQQRLRIEDFGNEEQIYCYNKLKSAFLITIYRQDGSSELINIPQTFIPVCLTDYAQPTLIKSSSDIRRAVAKGLLELVKAEDANVVLSTGDATIEIDRLRRLENFNINVDKPIEITPMEAIKDLDDSSVRVVIKDTLMRSDIDDKDAVAILNSENFREAFTKKELEFIVVSSSNKQDVYNWAVDKIKVLDGALFK